MSHCERLAKNDHDLGFIFECMNDMNEIGTSCGICLCVSSLCESEFKVGFC